MSEKKLTELSAASSVSDADLFYVVSQGGVSQKALRSQVLEDVLRSSSIIVGPGGALQTAGVGNGSVVGNARGTGAVDLQTRRGGVTQVASGNWSVLSGGYNNTASGVRSFVGGGYDNTASGDHSFVGAGYSGGSLGAYSVVCGGKYGNAQDDYAFVGGGQGNAAAGQWSVVAGGGYNAASGKYSTIGGGYSNSVTADYGFIGGGNRGVVSLRGQHANANGKFSTNGDAQTSHVVVRKSTTNATQTELFLDGSSAKIALPNNTTWAFRALVSARRTNTSGDNAAYEIKGCIKRDANAGTTAIVGSVGVTVIAESDSSWDVTATADATNGALSIMVTGANSKTIRWVAKVELAEVGGAIA